MHQSPVIQWAGLNIDLSTIFMIVVTSIVVFVVAKLGVRSLSITHPGKMQQFMEWLIDFVRQTIGSAMDMKIGKKFVSLGLTLIMFIFIANMLGLPFAIVTKHEQTFHVFGLEVVTVTEKLQKAKEKQAAKEEKDAHVHAELVWWKSPTADASVTLALALIVIFMVHFLGIRDNTRAYFKHYVEPNPLFLPIHLIEQLTSFLTLGLRLYGNIFAGEVLIAVLVGMGVFGIPGLIVWQGFSIFVGAIQAFVFVMLTMVYLGQKLEHHADAH